VHNSMLKPSRSIKILTFMLLAAVGRLDGRRQAARRAPQELLQGLLCEIIDKGSMPCSCSSWHRWSP